MITIFTLTSNRSSRKSVSWFTENEIPFREQKMNSNPLTLHQVREILKHTTKGTDDILATKSKAYEKLIAEGINFDELTLFELAYIIRKEPTIIKAPIILGYNKVNVGFNDDAIKRFMPRVEKMAYYNKQLEEVRAVEDKRIDETGQHNKYAVPGGRAR